ncbi:hypothetical protein [Sorangium sp. So ce362]|uniref:hypothetical protein n=1 Tax=Sorangium sp. So ce362 TaxID=3133303 RepID=UPI003F6433DF
MEHKVEYLVVFDSTRSICGTVESFVNLLGTIDGAEVSVSSIKWDGSTARCEMQKGSVGQGTPTEHFFHIRIYRALEHDIEHFEKLLRLIRTVLQIADPQRSVEVLWDDLAFERAATVYPALCGLENTMRKLIAKFMIQSVGVQWTKEAVPQEVADSIRQKRADRGIAVLYDLDFIRLSDLLFREYTSPFATSLAQQVRIIKSEQDLKIDDLRKALPRSNWERYFSNVVNCDATYISSRWARLYELRNNVAHNRGLSREEHKKSTELILELKDVLQRAIGSLDSVIVPEDEKEAVAENIAGSRHALIGQFLYSWSGLQRSLVNLAELAAQDADSKKRIQQYRYNLRVLLGMMSKNGIRFDKEVMDLFHLVIDFRNVVVHQPDAVPSDDDIAKHLQAIAILQDEVASCLSTQERSKASSTDAGA